MIRLPSARRLCVATALILGVAVAPVQAAPILEFTGGALGSPNLATQYGWAFSASTPLTVTALGLWDEGDNGLLSSHTVSLWAMDSGVLLASATVSNSSTDVDSPNTSGDWRFTSITPLLLGQGDYVIAATYSGGDNLRFVATTVSTTSGITFLGGRFGGLGTMPTSVGSFNSYFGPNLSASSVPVPEPTSMLLLGTGLLGAGVRRWRQKRT